MGIELDRRFTYGNIITIVAFLVTFLATFIGMQYQIANTQKDIATIHADTLNRVNKFETIASVYEARIRAVEITQASQTSDLRNIQNGINDIKSALGRIGGPHSSLP